MSHTIIGTSNGSGILSDSYEIALHINDGFKKDLWFDEHNGLPPFWNNPDINSIAYTDSTVIVGTSNGMYVCDRRNYQMHQVRNGLPSASGTTFETIQFETIQFHVRKISSLNKVVIAHIQPSNYIAQQLGQWNMLYLSTDMGYTWQKCPLPDVDSTCYVVDFTTANDCIVALYSNNKGEVTPYVSKNNGKSWHLFDYGLQSPENYWHICTIGDSFHIMDAKNHQSWIRPVSDVFGTKY